MSIRIALAGNPNSGKTTLFNALTGSNQFVGNWPGVTVEKKEGKLKKHDDVVITDLPGIYSLSPYTLEEVVARNYLIAEKPDAILNIVDGTNLERNLYLTTQLAELGIPVVIAINMLDILEKEGNIIDTDSLSKKLGLDIVSISALKGTNIEEAAEAAIRAAGRKGEAPSHKFSDNVEKAIEEIESLIGGLNVPESEKRWYAIKLFERDSKVFEQLSLNDEIKNRLEEITSGIEKENDDDAESIITNERYVYIENLVKGLYKKKASSELTSSDKIDKIVTNRWLGLPIFALVMFLIYYIAMVTVGASATNWANDGLFGDGYHLFGIGSGQYEEVAEEYGDAANVIDAFIGLDEDADMDSLKAAYATIEAGSTAEYTLEDEETLATEDVTYTYDELTEAMEVFEKYDAEEPDPAEYGIWVPGVPTLVETLLDKIGCADWLKSLILDGIIAGVGAVLGFVPQMLVLFFLLAFLEACGYMARIAFVLDRLFRRFGLSGKSFIPILIGTGCGIPGIMASRTIENERDRRMTIMTTTFIPCGAKIPFIAMIAGAIFNNSPWISTSAYFLGMASIIISGIILKKTKPFAGQPSPFVMELPAYHWPTLSNLLRSMWERGWSFIKKAGTVIIISQIVIWFLSRFTLSGGLHMVEEEEIAESILANVGSAIAWIFAPLGWGNWQAAVASITGLVAKENIVGTMGTLYSAKNMTAYQAMAQVFTKVTGYSFLAFNLLCAPCFAAIGAIEREMNNPKWTWFAIAYQCGFAYLVAFVVTQVGSAFTGNMNVIGLVLAIAIIVFALYMLFRPYKEAERLTQEVKVN
ncbi:MAG: ferrous iron transport protein B [Erysipelotrichaceae bacterium]|nr:ferrous iron transport protein B [Erysipelotrichaceae bacterium]